MLTLSLPSNATTDSVIDMARHQRLYKGQPLVVDIVNKPSVQLVWNGEHLRLPTKKEKETLFNITK